MTECTRLTFEAFADALAPNIACTTTAIDDYLQCIAERGCVAATECSLIQNAYVRACRDLVEDFAFQAPLTDCQRPGRLGRAMGCPDSPSLGSALGAGVWRGDTTGGGDDVTLGCHPDAVDFDSADLSAEWRAPAAGTYRIALDRVTFFGQLAVLDGCGGAELACESSAGGLLRQVSVEVELEALQAVVLVVEGARVTESGYFSLDITQLE